MRRRLLSFILIAAMAAFLAACGGSRRSSVFTNEQGPGNVVAFRFTVAPRGETTVPADTAKVEVEFQSEDNRRLDIQSKNFQTELLYFSPPGSRFCRVNIKNERGVCTRTETFPLVFVDGRAEFTNPRLERFNSRSAVRRIEFQNTPASITVGNPVQFRVVDPDSGADVTELATFSSSDGAFSFDPNNPGLGTPGVAVASTRVIARLRRPIGDLAVTSPDGGSVSVYDSCEPEKGRLFKILEDSLDDDERNDLAWRALFDMTAYYRLKREAEEIQARRDGILTVGETADRNLEFDFHDNDPESGQSVTPLGELSIQGEGLSNISVGEFNGEEGDEVIVITEGDRVLGCDLTDGVDVFVEFDTPDEVASVAPAYPDGHNGVADGVYISTTNSSEVKKYDSNGNVVETLQAPANGCELQSRLVQGKAYLTMSAVVPGNPPRNRIITGALETPTTGAFGSARYNLICDTTFSPPGIPQVDLLAFQGAFILDNGAAESEATFLGMPRGQWDLRDPSAFFFFMNYGQCNATDPPTLRGPGESLSGANGRMGLGARSEDRPVLETTVTVTVANQGSSSGTSSTTGGTTIVGTGGSTTGGTGTTTGGSGSTSSGGSGTTSSSGGTGGTGGMPPPPIGYTVGPAAASFIPLGASEVIDPDVAIEDDFYVTVANRIGGAEGDHIVCRQFEGAFGAMTPIPIPFQLSGEFQASVPLPGNPAFSPAVAMDASRNFVVSFLLDVSAAIDVMGRTFVPDSMNPTGAGPAVSLVSAQNSEFFDTPRLDAAKAGVAGGDLAVLSSLEDVRVSAEVFQLPNLGVVETLRPVQVGSSVSAGQTVADVSVSPSGTKSIMVFSSTGGDVAGRLITHAGGTHSLGPAGEFQVFSGTGTTRNVSVDFISENLFVVVYDVEMGADSEVRGRLYEITGSTVSVVQSGTLASDVTGSDLDPDVAGSAQDDAFWVTWTRDVGGQTEVYGRLFDDQLRPRIPAEFQFSSGQGAPGTARSSAVAMNAAGDTVVVWEADSTPPLDAGRAVYLRLAERQ